MCLRDSCERVVPAVIVTNAPPEFAVAAGDSFCLDPGVLVGWDGLGCQLSTKPVGGLGDDDRPTEPACREGGRHAACSSADDHDLGSEFRHVVPLLTLLTTRP